MDSSKQVYMTREEYQSYLELGITVLAEDTLQNGIFAAWMESPSQVLPDSYRNRSTLVAFNAAKKFCEDEHVTPSQMALAYSMNCEIQAGAVFSILSNEQTLEYMQASDITIPKNLVTAINKPRGTDVNLYMDEVKHYPQMRELTIQAGKQAITISRIVCGMSHLGSDIDMDTSFAILDIYYAAGGRTFDTAHVYGKWGSEQESLSEQCLGKWIKLRGVRNEVQIITKGCHPDLASMDIPRVGAQFIEIDLEESLKALQTDYIDIYMLHRDNPEVPVAELIDCLNEKLKQGTIRSFSASNWTSVRIEEANDYARKHNLEGFTSSEINRTLAVLNPGRLSQDMPEVTTQELEYYRDKKMPILAWGSLAEGIVIKGAQGKIDAVSPLVSSKYKNKATLYRIENLKRIMKESNLSAPELCIAYITNHPISSAALISASSVDQMKDNMKAAGLEISEQMVREMEYVPESIFQEMEQENSGDNKLPLDEPIDFDTLIGKMRGEGFEDIFDKKFGPPGNSQAGMLLKLTFGQVLSIPGIEAHIKKDEVQAFLDEMNFRREELLAKE